MDVLDIKFEDIERAKKNISSKVYKSPLVPLNFDCPHGKIYLKLENLQEIGCFKIRGACNVIEQLSPEALKNGVYTGSAGNFGQALAWCSKIYGIDCDVIVPDKAPDAKVQPMQRLGANVEKVTFDRWWEVIQSHKYEGKTGTFVHPVSDRAVIAGNGTAGIEIFESLPSVDAVIVPFGGGGLISGIGTALKHYKPETKVFACEVETAAPLSASFKADKPVMIDNYEPSFVDGIGGKSVLEEMWPLLKKTVDDSLVVSLQEVADALKLLVEKNHVIAEGAGAAAVAAALSGRAGTGNIVCVISGGNIDTSKLVQILQGKVPE